MNKQNIIDKLKTYNLGLKRGTVGLKPYQDSWSDAFVFVCDLIIKATPGSEVCHVGSTSVKGCSAKPILDVLIFHSAHINFAKETKALENIGFKAKGEYGISGRTFCTFYDLDEKFDFIHIHAFPKRHSNGMKLLDFKENLLGNSQNIEKYNSYKASLVESGVSRKEYPDAKTGFIKGILEPKKNKIIHFAKTKREQSDSVKTWLTKPHITEWLHSEGLNNTFVSLDESFIGDSDMEHWIAYEDGNPFGYLITSEVDKNFSDVSGIDSDCGKAITLDLFIFDEDYLGRGYGTRMIKEFLLSMFPNITDVLIDPEIRNERAIHVYKKVGFKIIKEFIASWHPVPHYQMHLRIADWS
ncbi:MAG: GNAT family N-acetyltransferase [Oligoflexales bacterium]